MSAAGNNNDPFLINDPFAENNNAGNANAANTIVTAVSSEKDALAVPIVPETSISSNINNNTSTTSSASFVADSLNSNSSNSVKSDLTSLNSIASNDNSVGSDLSDTVTAVTPVTAPVTNSKSASLNVNSIASNNNSVKSDLSEASVPIAAAAPAVITSTPNIESASSNVNPIKSDLTDEPSIKSNESPLNSSINTSVKSNLTNSVASNMESVSNFEGITDPELLELWDTESDFDERDKLVRELQRRNLFPSATMTRWEYESGAYPDVKDPEFLQKLLAKREFAESLQTTWKPRTDPCEDTTSFEVTPVQRFVANFMSPKTPYMSALLFHGVGVGKTCAAVQIIEAWLESYPRTEVYLVAPPTIQQGFFRTIFDITKVKIGEGKEPNSASQCTGVTYMKLTNTLYERDPEKIEKLVNKAIRRRYKVFGYISFANFIRDTIKGIPSGASEELKAQLKKEYIRKKFSGKLLIVDEAHNLRDIIDDTETGEIVAGGKAEKGDTAGGKILTPYLQDVLKYSEAMKFCMLTATPMYNVYKEIIFMLNLLLLNDKQATITEADIFNKEGQIIPTGREKLSYIAQRYVSFMRGENPLSFPVRLFPLDTPKLTSYPDMSPRGTPIPDEEKTYYRQLPIVPIMLGGDVLKATVAFMNVIPPGKGLSTVLLERLVHAGNFIVPSTPETTGDTLENFRERTNISSLEMVFNKETIAGEVRYRAKSTDGAKWLGVGELARYSPKFEFLINTVRKAEGCIFAYTRFVNAGALPLALALEANGYTVYGRKAGLLANGIQTPGGRQCALCPRREREHEGASHTFMPAYYGILTGDITISPKNEATIRAQRAFDNVDGGKMKIIIGSQIASEGVDLRFVRETHVIDSWFHLNKTEQILGRAIRFLSHCALPKEKRNNMVYLYTGQLPASEFPRETADLYSYRIGFKKAVLIGNVTRTLKIGAVDCNLNRDAIIIRGQPPMREIDAQGRVREEVNINDMPFTAVCDWIETCEYECKPKINVKELAMDDSTYDEFSARWRVNRMKQRLITIFADQPFYQAEDIWNLFADVPRLAVVDLLSDIVDNKAFQVTHEGQNGYIRYCNGYYIFQPNVYADLSIPLAIRVAKFPIKRDEFSAIEYEIPEIAEVEETGVSTTETIEGIWKAISGWCQSLSTSAEYINPPYELEQRITEVSHENVDVIDKYQQILEMVKWFHTSFVKSHKKNSEAFRLSLQNYFWDEWLTLEEQKFLVYSTGLNVEDCIRESQYRFGRILVNRFLDPKTGQLEFMCEGGEGCVTSIVDEIERDKEELLRSFKINRLTTGNTYGFVAPKNGDVVFKTAEPPEVAGKLGRGKECANVSTMTGHLRDLIEIGDILKTSERGDFDLNEGILRGSRKIKNATRACALLDFLIRYLDESKVRGKRWFFRPVAALYAGHGGKFRPGGKK